MPDEPKEEEEKRQEPEILGPYLYKNGRFIGRPTYYPPIRAWGGRITVDPRMQPPPPNPRKEPE